MTYLTILRWLNVLNISSFWLQQQSSAAWLYQETLPPEEAQRWQQEQRAEAKEEEDYEVDQTDLIREDPSLDRMAELITVEEVRTSTKNDYFKLNWVGFKVKASHITIHISYCHTLAELK